MVEANLVNPDLAQIEQLIANYKAPEEANLFNPDLAQIEQLIANYEAPEKSVLQIQIDPAQALIPLDDHFTCTVCLNVAVEPKECSQCHKLNCD